eukprot:8069167-Ditylum_brightwellii.AAC.1
MFGANSHDIPDADKCIMSKLGCGGVVATDTCNGARALCQKIVREVEKAAKEKSEVVGGDDSGILVLQQD